LLAFKVSDHSLLMANQTQPLVNALLGFGKMLLNRSGIVDHIKLLMVVAPAIGAGELRK